LQSEKTRPNLGAEGVVPHLETETRHARSPFRAGGRIAMINFILWVVTTTLYILALADVVRSQRSLSEKIVLVALIVALPVIGPALYLFILRDRK
jgi:hypothetical protein